MTKLQETKVQNISQKVQGRNVKTSFMIAKRKDTFAEEFDYNLSCHYGRLT